MDKLSDAQLVDLRNRCMRAAGKGHEVARAEEYMVVLATELGEKHAQGDKVTAANLIAAVNAVVEQRAGAPKKVEAPAPAPKPVVAETVPTVVPDGELFSDVEPESVAEPVVEAPKSEHKGSHKSHKSGHKGGHSGHE
jgi:hypothetical protein